MSGTAHAQQIAALTEKLAPLAGKARGMRIQADEWNAVIDVLSGVLRIDLAQAQDSSSLADQRFAPVDHQHLGQVSTAWLDADLQARTGDGGGSISTRQSLAQIQQTVASLQTQVATLTAMVQTQQGTTDRASANEIDRGRQLQGFETRFSGVEDLRTLVTGVAQSQLTLKTDVGTVLELKKSLSDATGAPINVAGLSQQIAGLQVLRDSLTGIDGKPLRLRDLQLQVMQLSDAVPSAGGGTLETRLATLSTDLQAKAVADAASRIGSLRTELNTANASLSTGLATKLETEISAGRDAAAAAATAQVAAAETRLNATFATGIAIAQATLATDLAKNVGDTVTKGLSGLNEQIATAVDARTPGLQAQLRTDLKTALDTDLQTSVAAVETRLTARVSTVETGLATTTQAIPAQVQASVAASAATLKSSLDTQVATQAATLKDQLTAILDDRVKTGVAAGLGDVKATATQVVADNLKDLDTRIGMSVAAATKTLPDQISATVSTSLAAANLGARIEGATTALATQLRNEIAISAATVQATSQNAVNSAVVNLRGEFSATRTRAVLPATSLPIGVTNVIRPG